MAWLPCTPWCLIMHVYLYLTFYLYLIFRKEYWTLDLVKRRDYPPTGFTCSIFTLCPHVQHTWPVPSPPLPPPALLHLAPYWLCVYSWSETRLKHNTRHRPACQRHLPSCLFTCRGCSGAETCSWSGSTRRWRRWARPPAAAAARPSRWRSSTAYSFAAMYAARAPQICHHKVWGFYKNVRHGSALCICH